MVAGNVLIFKQPNMRRISYDLMRSNIPTGSLILAKCLNFNNWNSYGAFVMSNAVWTHVGMIVNFKSKPYILSMRPFSDSISTYNLLGDSEIQMSSLDSELDEYKKTNSIVAVRLPKHKPNEDSILNFATTANYSYQTTLSLIRDKFIQYFGGKQLLRKIIGDSVDGNAITCSEFTGLLLKASGLISPIDDVHGWEPTDYSSERKFLSTIYTNEIQIL
jgi:hypothetical protein